MNYIKAAEVYERMDKWGKAEVPFLFFIDYGSRLGQAFELSDISPSVAYDFRGKRGGADISVPSLGAAGVKWHAVPPAYAEYKRSFDVVMRGLLRGDSFLTNLTAASRVETNLSLSDLFALSSAPYKLLVDPCFVCLSPEPFVRITEGKIYSYPMKGTIACRSGEAEGIARQALLDNAKEAAEHATIVDLIRNDLSMVSTRVRVDRYRYVERISTLRGDMLATSSEISGALAEGWQGQLGQIFRRLLPGGSITGAPKASTVGIIAEAEDRPRGFYTGVCGIFDGTSLDSAVMIRFVERTPGGEMFFHSGGGITAMSNARDEYEELILKTNAPIH